MDERNLQHLNLPQGSGEPYTAFERISFDGTYMSKTRHLESQLSNLLPCNYFQPTCDHWQAEYHGVLCSELSRSPLATTPPVPYPEAGVQMTLTPGMSDGNLGDETGAFSDDQFRAIWSRPGRCITDQKDASRGTNSPFLNQGNMNDVQLFFVPSHSHASHVSPLRLEYTPGTHPFKHHQGQSVEAPEFGEFQWIPEIEIAQSSEKSRKKWPCHRDGCNKIYRRHQELRRHRRDKHDISHKCFFCDFKWTRADMIRKHILSRHEDYFTEEERQEIRRLRGLIDTIGFFENWGTPWL